MHVAGGTTPVRDEDLLQSSDLHTDTIPACGRFPLDISFHTFDVKHILLPLCLLVGVIFQLLKTQEDVDL